MGPIIPRIAANNPAFARTRENANAFVQEVNGADYLLQNGAFNVMNIVGVAGS